MPKMQPKMQPVESSNVRAIGYTPGPDGRPGNLYAQFTSGTVYVYADVPADMWEALRDAPSKGSFLAKNIRGVFSYHKQD